MKPSSLQKLEKMDEFKFKPKWHEKKESKMIWNIIRWIMVGCLMVVVYKLIMFTV